MTVLICLCIIGAFIGPLRTKAAVNSLPIGLYWIALIFVLLLAILSLFQSPSLALLHVGPLLVIIGGTWGSIAGHQIRQQITGSHKVPSGRMLILEGTQEDLIEDTAGKVSRLPFAVRLVRFRIEYYRPGYITVRTPKGDLKRFDATPGNAYFIGPGKTKLEVLQIFDNLKVAVTQEGNRVYDDPNGHSNPAALVRLIEEGKTSRNVYLFSRYSQWHDEPTGLEMAYWSPIKDFISDLEILQAGKVVTRKSIEVNKPLHYAGYYLLQASYGIDPQTGRSYSILSVVSDSGLCLVFAGYVLILMTMAWQLWIKRVFMSAMTARKVDPEGCP